MPGLPPFLPDAAARMQGILASWLAGNGGAFRLERRQEAAAGPYSGWTAEPFLLLPLAGTVSVAGREAGPGTALWFAAGSFVLPERYGLHRHLRLNLGAERIFLAERRAGRLHGALLRWEDAALAGRLVALVEASPAADPDLMRAVLRLVVRAMPEAAADAPPTARLVAAFLEGHLGQDLGRRRVARIFGIHPNHLARIFRRELGCSYCGHVRRRRLAQAQALAATGLPPAEVAVRCGYGSARALARAARIG